MMNSNSSHERLRWLTAFLEGRQPSGWGEIIEVLDHIQNQRRAEPIFEAEEPLQRFAGGTAFLTFAYGIDGVSIEIAKYAQTLEAIYRPLGEPAIHLIGDRFKPEVSSIFSPAWRRHTIKGINGWDKWEGGVWFETLFHREMKAKSEESRRLAGEIYRQAVSIAKRLGTYLSENQIALLIPVNVASNPGNLALTLAVAMVTEALGVYVLNSNHDFYWEAGKPASDRDPDEEPGPRDHFFRNRGNRAFFKLFERLYPWNGKRWLQININARQSRKLIQKYGVPKKRVFEISTCLNDEFFEPFTKQDVTHARRRMGLILSGGETIIRPIPVDEHLAQIDSWMKHQSPCILGAQSGLSIDPASQDLIVLLQPTRIVDRKRIERNLELIQALLGNSPLGEEFEGNPRRQLVLHVTGPVPREHQAALEVVLQAYRQVIAALPEHIARRVFVAFSVGQEEHPSFSHSGFEALTIESIYRMADAVLFPSETEGRGLPIIEAAASGVPIITSQYRPKEVFEDVIGKGLKKELRLRYTLFPEGKFNQRFLSAAANLLLNPGDRREVIGHNRRVVRARYSRESLQKKFSQLLDELGGLA